jgi:hypothetical protein
MHKFLFTSKFVQASFVILEQPQLLIARCLWSLGWRIQNQMSTLLMLFPVVQHNRFILIPFFHIFETKNKNWESHTLKRTFCSRRKFSRGSIEEKLISLDTALQFKILLGTLASCSTSGWDLKQKCTKNVTDIVYNLKPLSRTHKSSEFCHSSLPVSTSRRLIQFLQ